MTERTGTKLEDWRAAGKISAEALVYAAGIIAPGASVLDVAERTEEFVYSRGADMAFPLVVSINNVACHYTPGAGCELRFEKGDLVKLDTGACIDGCVGDNAVTIEVGNTSLHTELIKASREALEAGLEIIGPGVSILAPAKTMNEIITSHGFKTVANLTGHFVERNRVHTKPFIPSVLNDWFIKNCDYTFAEGQFATLEPFASTGDGMIVDGIDGNLFELLKRANPAEERLRKVEDYVYTKFGKSGLFTDRWCRGDFKDPGKLLRVLHEKGSVHAYPASVERSKDARVSQAEVMFIVTSDGCEILTKV